MDEVISRSTSRQRVNHDIDVDIWGGAALLLAAIGVYGLMAYSVEQRTQEIGIRMALSAEANHVRKMVVFECLIFSPAGVVLGTSAAYGPGIPPCSWQCRCC
jgi:putative ABC transport system permease protein